MATSCVIRLPLGISRAREKEEIEKLRSVFGSFEFIDFNLARVGEYAFSIRITRSRVPNAQNDVMEIDETVGGLRDDNLRLTYGEYVQFLERIGSEVNVRFSNYQI